MRTIERRIGLLFAGFLLCFLIVVGSRLLAAGRAGRRARLRGDYQQTEAVAVPGLRGSVLDRHGNALAASEDAATIFAIPSQVKNPVMTAEKLAPILDLEPRRRAA